MFERITNFLFGKKSKKKALKLEKLGIIKKYEHQRKIRDLNTEERWRKLDIDINEVRHIFKETSATQIASAAYNQTLNGLSFLDVANDTLGKAERAYLELDRHEKYVEMISNMDAESDWLAYSHGLKSVQIKKDQMKREGEWIKKAALFMADPINGGAYLLMTNNRSKSKTPSGIEAMPALPIRTGVDERANDTIVK